MGAHPHFDHIAAISVEPHLFRSMPQVARVTAIIQEYLFSPLFNVISVLSQNGEAVPDYDEDDSRLVP